MNPLTRVNVVLVRPMYPRNIGMCARSMANMGTGRLVLIAPQCELDYDAQQGATHAQEILKEAKTYKSLDAFYNEEGEGVRIALSGRAGELRAAGDRHAVAGAGAVSRRQGARTAGVQSARPGGDDHRHHE